MDSYSIATLPQRESLRDPLSVDEDDVMADTIRSFFKGYHIDINIIGLSKGPIYTLFEVSADHRIMGGDLAARASDLCRFLMVDSVRVLNPIPGTFNLGIEISNKIRETVFLSELINASPPSFNADSPWLSVPLGKDSRGHTVTVDLMEDDHLLISGTTGSGKTVCIDAIIVSLLCKFEPAAVRFIMIDPFGVDLSKYSGIPHLLTDVITTQGDISPALCWCQSEMKRRMKIMSEIHVSDDFRHPRIYIIISDFYEITRHGDHNGLNIISVLARDAHRVGIHLIIATSRPSAEVMSGDIKSAIKARIVFKVRSQIDSLASLNRSGAELLLGHGDMLYLSAKEKEPRRVHGAFVSEEDIDIVVNHCKKYPAEYINFITCRGVVEEECIQDDLYDQAVSFVVEKRKASINLLQHHFRIGYHRATTLIEKMESTGVVTSPDGQGRRQVIIFTDDNKDEYTEIFKRYEYSGENSKSNNSIQNILLRFFSFFTNK